MIGDDPVAVYREAKRQAIKDGKCVILSDKAKRCMRARKSSRKRTPKYLQSSLRLYRKVEIGTFPLLLKWWQQ